MQQASGYRYRTATAESYRSRSVRSGSLRGLGAGVPMRPNCNYVKGLGCVKIYDQPRFTGVAGCTPGEKRVVGGRIQMCGFAP